MNNFLDKYATVGVILSGLALCMSACTAQRIAITPIGEPEVPSAAMPGVDSNLVAQAYALAEVSFARDAEAAVRLAEEGRKLVQLADSLVGGPAPEHRWPPDAADSAHRDIAAGTQAFNAGAEALAKYVEADSIRAVELLVEAAARFEEAIEADPFDEEARYWLARAYELIAARTNTQGPPQAAIEVLQRLVALHRDRHDYIALLAAAYGRVRTDEAFLAAGALWERAAQVAQDDALLDPDQTIVADTGVVFAYYVRGSRAFVEANRSDLALNALHSARSWTRTPEDHALVSSESAYIEWDRGNLANRKQFDALLEIASASPDKAAAGLEELAESVTHAKARMDVQHQLALAWYATGEYESAIGLMQELWHKSGNADSMTAGRLREDYATMAYNLAQIRRHAGDLVGALAYLLQCEKAGSEVSGKAAFQAAQLLRNNLDAALERALAAENRLEHLSELERESLFRYIAELYRRKGDRESAKRYVQRLTEERQGDNIPKQ